MVKRVRSLLDELNFIRKDQVIGVCEHCKRNPGACKKCQFIVKKFLDSKTDHNKEKQDQFKFWLSKLNQYLHNVLNDENLHSGQINNDPSALELERLLQELKRPLQLTKFQTTFFPTDLAQLNSMTAGNDMIDELITKIKPEDLRKPVLDEYLPPMGMQLPNEHQKGGPRRLPSLTRAIQEKRLHEYAAKDNVLENQSKGEQSNVTEEKNKSISEITTIGSTSNTLKKEITSKKQFHDNASSIIETHRKKDYKKENNKSISKMTSKGFTTKPLEKYSENQSQEKKRVKKETQKPISEMKSNRSTSNQLDKDNLSNVIETHRKEAIKTDINNAISEITSKGSSLKRHKKDNAKNNQSIDKSNNVKENNRKKETKKEKNKSIPDMLIRDSTLKPLLKRLSNGDGKKNKNSGEAKVINFPDVPRKNMYKNEHKDKKKDKKSVNNIQFVSSNEDMDIVKLIEIYNQEGKKHAKENQNKTNSFVNVELPLVKIQEAGDESDDDDFFSLDSFVESNQQGPDLITKMINKTKLVKYDPQYKGKNLVTLSEEDENNILPDSFLNTVEKTQSIKKHSTRGVLRYKLSNKTFIRKGYTILPVIKIMKRVNLYKMEPVNPQFNWFERHKDVGTKNYDTGEILADIKENGTGRWFYKNGRIALDYYNAEDVIARQRYVLYSSGEESNQDQGVRLKELKNKPQVLGVFDFLGNGAVYDLHGNERIKYNQTEGMIMDSKIGPVGRWKWHSLNDPPVLEPVVIDNYDHSFCIGKLEHLQRDEGKNLNKRYQNPEVLKTELQIVAKKKADKLLQKFKPYQIRMKAFKVNDELSLRIIDQANIYLLFRHGAVSMKLNLGLHLVSTEIVDTDASEVGAVATPYDQIPPRTSSLANIQHNLQNARNLQSKAKARKTPSIILPLSKLDMSSRSSIY